MWARAALSVALRGPGKALLLAATAGWVATAWTLGAFAAPAPAALHQHAAAPFDAALVWTAMILAMAPPLLRREVGVLWRSTLPRRRGRALFLFAAGYVTVWLLAGLVIVPAAGWAAAGAPRSAAALGLVLLWHCSPARQRFLNACHRTPALPLFGIAADGGALRYGASSGASCSAACGLLMLLVLLVADYHLLAMAVAAALATIERHLPARPPRWQLPLLAARTPAWPGGRLDGYPAGVSR